MSRTSTILLSTMAMACGTAYADRAPLMPYPSPRWSPYDVEILGDGGESLATYQHRGRFYVLGDNGGRYVIKIQNPTPRRVEAVVTVDGLDAIDGENGDLRKRGYVVPAYGELRVEGFRTSTSDVATFRFSSVGASYAGRKGKARNVGVIAVAFFDEQAPPEVIMPSPPVDVMPPPYDDRDKNDYYRRSESGGATSTKSATKRSAAQGDRSADASAPPSASPSRVGAGAGSGEGEMCCSRPTEPRRERQGLGTEFGEQRYSAVSFTRFVRKSSRPMAVAELRYNNAAGLMALGIPVAPMPDYEEVVTRETADPFPGDHFARPPAGIR